MVGGQTDGHLYLYSSFATKKRHTYLALNLGDLDGLGHTDLAGGGVGKLTHLSLRLSHKGNLY